MRCAVWLFVHLVPLVPACPAPKSHSCSGLATGKRAPEYVSPQSDPRQAELTEQSQPQGWSWVGTRQEGSMWVFKGQEMSSGAIQMACGRNRVSCSCGPGPATTWSRGVRCCKALSSRSTFGCQANSHSWCRHLPLDSVCGRLGPPSGDGSSGGHPLQLCLLGVLMSLLATNPSI